MRFSVRLRILLGFVALATANLVSAFSLRGLDRVSNQIIVKTDIVRLVNDYTNDITAQTMALRAFAFSGRDADKAAMSDARTRAQQSRQQVEALLEENGEQATVDDLNGPHLMRFSPPWKTGWVTKEMPCRLL